MNLGVYWNWTVCVSVYCVRPSVYPYVCKISFCQRSGRGIEPHLVKAVIGFVVLIPLN